MAIVNWNRMDSEVTNEKMALIFSVDKDVNTSTAIELTPTDIHHLMRLLIRSRSAMLSLQLREKIFPLSSR